MTLHDLYLDGRYDDVNGVIIDGNRFWSVFDAMNAYGEEAEVDALFGILPEPDDDGVVEIELVERDYPEPRRRYAFA